MFGHTSIVKAGFSPDGSLAICINVKVNSTGWSLHQQVSRDDQGRISMVELQPQRPTGISGPGFSSAGQNFDIQLQGPFADVVAIVTPDDSITVIQ